MKKLLAILLVSSLSIPLWAGDIWESPVEGQFVSRETPLSVAVGSGLYIGVYEGLKYTKLSPTIREWTAFATVGFFAWFKEREVDFEVNSDKASFTDMAWTMGGATFTRWLWHKQEKKKAYASLNFTGKQLFFSYNF